MNDGLQQLLRRADASAPAPPIDAANLPHNIRRSLRNQRRLVACGLASVFLLVATTLFVSRLHQSPHVQSPVAESDFRALQLDAEVHERTAALLLAAKPHAPTQIDPTDTFLINLAAQRNQTALLLLRDADRLANNDETSAAAAVLRRTISLFPDTPAASRAGKQLEQLENARRQS